MSELPVSDVPDASGPVPCPPRSPGPQASVPTMTDSQRILTARTVQCPPHARHGNLKVPTRVVRSSRAMSAAPNDRTATLTPRTSTPDISDAGPDTDTPDTPDTPDNELLPVDVPDAYNLITETARG